MKSQERIDNDRVRSKMWQVKCRAEHRCYKCFKSLLLSDKAHCGDCLLTLRQQAKEHRDFMKARILSRYGYKCRCCGESNELFLTIDHINNDGNKHRKEMNYRSIYVWLVKNNYPDNFQILCYNCNCGKSRNKGVCPHKEILFAKGKS